jgi:hypothetical protein
VLHLSQLLEDSSDQFTSEITKPDDPALIIYTRYKQKKKKKKLFIYSENQN